MNNDEPYNVDINIVVHQLGFPGESLDSWLMDAGADAAFSPQGSKGSYQVEMILARPSQLPRRDLFDPHGMPFDGNSFIRLAKKKSERRPKDLHRLDIDTRIGRIVLLPNDEGFAGKFVSEEFFAEHVIDAEVKFRQIVMPLISGYSMYLDTPIHIEMVRVREVNMSRTFSRLYAPFWPTWLGPAGCAPTCDPEFIHYAAVYREALNSNSPFYRFLCLYKLLESIGERRERIDREAKKGGREIVQRPEERMPKTQDEFDGFLQFIYPFPWLKTWDFISVQQIFIPGVLGKTVQEIMTGHLRLIRNRIAHGLMNTGELGLNMDNLPEIQLVARWLPLLRCLTRLRLRNDFPTQFVFEMKPSEKA